MHDVGTAHGAKRGKRTKKRASSVADSQPLRPRHIPTGGVGGFEFKYCLGPHSQLRDNPPRGCRGRIPGCLVHDLKARGAAAVAQHRARRLDVVRVEKAVACPVVVGAAADSHYVVREVDVGGREEQSDEADEERICWEGSSSN